MQTTNCHTEDAGFCRSRGFVSKATQETMHQLPESFQHAWSPRRELRLNLIHLLWPQPQTQKRITKNEAQKYKERLSFIYICSSKRRLWSASRTVGTRNRWCVHNDLKTACQDKHRFEHFIKLLTKQASKCEKDTYVQEGQYWFLMISTECTKMYSLLKNIDVTIAGSPVPKGQKINAKSTLSEFHFCCLAALCILETCYSMRALNILVFENRVCVQLSSWYEPNKNAIYLFIRLFLFISKVVSLKLEIAA